MQRKPRWQVEVSTGSACRAARSIAPAIAGCTKMRAAFDHLARNLDVWAGRDRSCPPPAARADSPACSRISVGDGSPRTSPWSTPRPCRSCRRGRSRSVDMSRRETSPRSRRRADSARETRPAGIGHRLAVRFELIAPGVFGAFEPPARGELPFRLCRQRLARPCRIGLGVAIGDVHHGIVVETPDRAAGPVRMAPVGAEAKVHQLKRNEDARPIAGALTRC
jgi:hypothetical protein